MKVFFASLLLALLLAFTPPQAHAGPIKDAFKTGNLCGFPGNACCDSQTAIAEAKAAQDPGFFASLKDWFVGALPSVVGRGGDVINDQCHAGVPTKNQATGACECAPDDGVPIPENLKSLTTICDTYARGTERTECINALKQSKFPTSFGPVDIDLGDFVSTYILRTLLGVAGIYALLSLIYASFKLQVSHGDKERVTKAKEMATASLMGLILIIFSLFILSFIGKGILGLPGFN